MLTLGSLAFASPWLLAALAGAAGHLVAAAGDAAGAAPHRAFRRCGCCSG